MDFKVAGTEKGVTALQMDIKIKGITEEIMEQALHQAHEARLHILKQMNEVLPELRKELSANAPTMISMKIDSDKIRDVIGKGGATIRGICEETGASRSEERRVGKECRSRWSPEHEKKKIKR